MFLLKRAFPAIAAIGLSMVLSTGCKTTPNKPVESPAPAVSAPTLPALQPGRVRLPPDSGDNMSSNILAWDATEKIYHARPGDLHAPFTFSLTNVSATPVIIYDTSTTCDCTVASLPSKPWTVPSGGTGQIEATMDIHNKIGTVTKEIIVFTSRGNKRLKVTVVVPNS